MSDNYKSETEITDVDDKLQALVIAWKELLGGAVDAKKMRILLAMMAHDCVNKCQFDAAVEFMWLMAITKEEAYYNHAAQPQPASNRGDNVVPFPTTSTKTVH